MKETEKNIIPRVAAVHDLSGHGRVSLTEAIPILSAMGVEVCPLPTAVLSTHTYQFPGYTFCDLTEEMSGIFAHWAELNLKFDAVYSGYMGSARQIELLSQFIEQQDDDCLIVIDPVLGDNALLDVQKVYSKRMNEQIGGMRGLIAKADIITPNLTEACLLLEEEYPQRGLSEEEMKDLLFRLSDKGPRMVCITSVMAKDGKMYVAVYDRALDRYWKVDCGYVNRPFHGTGDVFTSALTGALLYGEDLIYAANKAVGFVSAAIAETLKHPQMQVRNGVLFEKVLVSYFSQKDTEIRYTEM
uniref:pyridoxal kinase n=1 Tax=uncultured Bacillota bacterium TaxID=344338 RepID=A0A650EP44_9FIRM|nr:pyridoxal kinase [uncultured Firmicutes bacterium]